MKKNKSFKANFLMLSQLLLSGPQVLPLHFLSLPVLYYYGVLQESICHFSDTWQLVINTGTTIITFLIVFVLAQMQKRKRCIYDTFA